VGLRQIANVLPTTHAFAAARDVLDGQGRAMAAPRALAARDGGGTRRGKLVRGHDAEGVPKPRLRHPQLLRTIDQPNSQSVRTAAISPPPNRKRWNETTCWISSAVRTASKLGMIAVISLPGAP